MSESNMQAFTNSIAAYVNSYILTPICNHLVSKGINVSLEELAGVLHLPAAANVAPRPAFANHPAVSPFMNSAPPIASSVSGSKAKASKAVEVRQEGGCAYEFKRGGDKGKFCSGRAEPGSAYCASCLKNRKSLPSVPSSGSSSSVPSSSTGFNSQPPANPGQVNAIEYDKARSLYILTDYGIVIHQSPKGEMVAVGRATAVTDPISPLRAEDLPTLAQFGINPAEPVASAPAPKIPSPQLPPAPAVPGIPQVPTVPGIPQVPTVPGIPQVPTVPSIPQVPGIPQLQ